MSDQDLIKEIFDKDIFAIITGHFLQVISSLILVILPSFLPNYFFASRGGTTFWPRCSLPCVAVLKGKRQQRVCNSSVVFIISSLKVAFSSTFLRLTRCNFLAALTKKSKDPKIV